MSTRLSPTISTTVAAMATNVLATLFDAPYSETHSNAPTSSGTSLTIATGGASRWEAGDIVEWREDGTGDLALVTAVADTALTIRRAYLGATAVSHAANAVIHKNPRFQLINVTKGLNDALAEDLFPDCYAVYETQITPNATVTENWYSIDAGAEEILRVYQKSSTNPIVLYNIQASDPEYVDTTLSSATFRAIYLGPLQDPTQTVFAQWTTIPAVGDLSSGMARVVEYGAIKRLLEWEAAEVNQDESIPTGGTMAPGQYVRDASWFMQEQDRLRRREKQFLDRRFRKRRRKWFGSPHVGDYRYGTSGPVFTMSQDSWY